jgi:hypothetical protein
MGVRYAHTGYDMNTNRTSESDGMDRKTQAQGYAVSLILIGIALASKEGDSQRVTDQLLPDLLEGFGPSRMLAAIQSKDKDGVIEFLASLGVQLLDGERAVDAILRTHLGDARIELERKLAVVKRAWDAEEKLATNTLKGKQA